MENDIIVALGHGPWSGHAISQYFDCITELHRSRGRNARGILAFFRGQILLTPDAEEEFEKLMKWRTQHDNNLPIAGVFIDQKDTGMFKRYMHALYTRFHIAHQFFESEGEARAWLESISEQ